MGVMVEPHEARASLTLPGGARRSIEENREPVGRNRGSAWPAANPGPSPRLAAQVVTAMSAHAPPSSRPIARARAARPPEPERRPRRSRRRSLGGQRRRSARQGRCRASRRDRGRRWATRARNPGDPCDRRLERSVTVSQKNEYLTGAARARSAFLSPLTSPDGQRHDADTCGQAGRSPENCRRHSRGGCVRPGHRASEMSLL